MYSYYTFISRYEYCAFAIYTCFSTSVFYNYTYLGAVISNVHNCS